MPNSDSGRKPRSTFQDYLSTRSLPVRAATVRVLEPAQFTIALIDYAPNRGLWFDPIDELVISVVIRSDWSRVVRDIGHGRLDLTYAPGCVLLTPRSRGSYWRFEGNPQVLHLTMPQSGVSDILGADYEEFEQGAFRAARYPCSDPLVAQLAMRIWTASHFNDAPRLSISRRGMAMMLALVMRNSDLAGDSRSTRPPPGLARWRLSKALGEISAHDGRVSAKQLADTVDLSSDHFRRAFKASTGSSPHAMASRIRVEKAKRLLTGTRQSMTEIALELGFSSASHFSTRFKQLTGMSPTDWRATHPD